MCVYDMYICLYIYICVHICFWAKQINAIRLRLFWGGWEWGKQRMCEQPYRLHANYKAQAGLADKSRSGLETSAALMQRERERESSTELLLHNELDKHMKSLRSCRERERERDREREREREQHRAVVTQRT